MIFIIIIIDYNNNNNRKYFQVMKHVFNFSISKAMFTCLSGCQKSSIKVMILKVEEFTMFAVLIF